ncbi:MAG: ABC transporter permease subunit, partial [Clostridia bacterium]|nr:ABC transporter permease subunit [Clostridia bacterium]
KAEGYEPITADSAAVKEAVGVTMFAISPTADTFKDYADIITAKDETFEPKAYADAQYLSQMLTAVLGEKLEGKENAINSYLASRYDDIDSRAEVYSTKFLAANMTTDTAKNALLDALSSYGVDEAKYDAFGYDYAQIDRISRESVITYRNRYDYEVNELGKTPEEANENLYTEVASSLLAALPDEVSDAIKEVGELDLYSLIVGSIFYKLAGLLLPIIYMIMASNNLIAGQVDRGSMAYVLSTSTKRESVVFTQALYLIGSLFAMFCLTTATGCVCLAIVKADSASIELTYGNLILLNLGAFLVLFALSGLCFFTSCYFDRSKLAMAIGGGLSIFALVAAMLGLFGTQTIPSVVRLDALNYFNYATVITLFDVISIIDKTGMFIWKFAILLVLGIVGYVLGSRKFVKKDLPL